MKIIRTDQMTADELTPWERDQVYNGLDCCVTLEVLNSIKDQLDNHTAATYNFSKELQGPVLEMRCRGVRVDQARRQEVLFQYQEYVEKLEARLERIAKEALDFPGFNWRSYRDLNALFYEHLDLIPIKKYGQPTTDRAAREQLAIHPSAAVICNHINMLADLGKKIAFLKTGIDPDGRIRSSYNIAGTSTGRFSSSVSEFGTGGNLQNIEESLRKMLIPDKGMKFAKCDAKSGESFCVGAIEWNLFKDGRFLDACESGDPHTAVARICWPTIKWTGDTRRDKELAEQPYYRHYTYRFMCKKLGHGSNYGGKPEALAEQAKLPLPVVQEFQPKYFKAFPAHQLWHGWVDDQLRRTGYLVTLTGRKRWFFGKRNDPSTLREAIAYDPQGSLADIVNTAMLNIWRKDIAPIVMHDHDALTFMYPEELEDQIIPQIMDNLIVPVKLKHGRELRIPYDCKVGWNKGEYDAAKNPFGLKDYKGTDTRKPNEAAELLDQVIRRKD